jgi:hypothetical protein
VGVVDGLLAVQWGGGGLCEAVVEGGEPGVDDRIGHPSSSSAGIASMCRSGCDPLTA